MKKFKIACMTLLGAMSLASCNSNTPTNDNPSQNPTSSKITSDSLYVEKVNLADDFIKGIDMSSLISLENAGVKFYDFDGKEQDPLKTVADCGVNYIRVRVWNDPFDAEGNGYGGGNNDIDTCVAIGKRATQYGMKLLVDFHYSDFWADPAKQYAPKAWANYTYEQKGDAIYEYTKASLEKLVSENVAVGMVQIGNESNAFFCGERAWGRIGEMMQRGCEAVREVTPDALIALHFTNPEKVGNYAKYAYQLATTFVDYDVFGSSYYPYWHGSLENLTTELNGITKKYGKKTMVLETSYAYSGLDYDLGGNTINEGEPVKAYPFTVQGQANHVRNVIDTVAKLDSGIGVCYWEGAWIPVGSTDWQANKDKWEAYGAGWASSYASEYDEDVAKYGGSGTMVDNQTFFDATGHPLESLKVWGLVNEGNELNVTVDAIADTTVLVDLAGDIVLPTEVDAVMNNNTKQKVSVTWDLSASKIQEMKTGGVKKYKVDGKTSDGADAVCYVNMIEYNFLTDYSFEDTPNKKLQAPWKVITSNKMDECYVESNVTNAVTGTNSFHFWSNAQGSVDFALEQDVVINQTSKFKASASVQGGDVGTYTCYLYVKVNGVEVGRVELSFNGWNSWDTKEYAGFSVNKGDTVTVGIYIKCEGANAGAWGNIDDVLLNSMVD